jgi:hypothetical protein
MKRSGGAVRYQPLPCPGDAHVIPAEAGIHFSSIRKKTFTFAFQPAIDGGHSPPYICGLSRGITRNGRTCTRAWGAEFEMDSRLRGNDGQNRE